MKKLSLFLAGMLLGIFITMFTVLHQRGTRDRARGPQPGHDEDWTHCEYLTKR